MELAPPTLPPSLSARFRIEAMLASGGFGAVWRAVDPAGRVVALKVLHAETLADANQVQRFLQEARAAALLKHPAIVPLVAQGLDDGLPWIAYELVEGESLRDRLDRGPLGIAQALKLARQLAGALGAAHAAGIVHRDVKPENVLCRGEDEVLLTDFGIARWAGGRVKTQTGVILGTPIYMPLEILKGLPVTPAADVYAAGVVLFEMLTGALPVEGNTPVEILRNLLQHEAARVSSRVAGVPAALDDLVASTLSHDPTRRPADGHALERALAALDDPTLAALAQPSGAVSRSGRPSRSTARPTRPHSRPEGGARAPVPSRASATAVSALPDASVAPGRMLALGPVAAAAILVLSGLSAWLVLRHQAAPAAVVDLPPSVAAPSPAPTTARASYDELVAKMDAARRLQREPEVRSLARRALDLLPRLAPADRPVIDHAALTLYVEHLISEVEPAARNGLQAGGNWLLLFRQEWLRREREDRDEHEEREEHEHHWHEWGPQQPPVLTAAQAGQLKQRLTDAAAWLPDALVATLSKPAPLVAEGRLVRKLVLLHFFDLDWPTQPLAPALERAFQELLNKHPDHWAAHVFAFRSAAVGGKTEATAPLLFAARDRFETRHAAERAAATTDADELCVAINLACMQVSMRREGGNAQRLEKAVAALRAHLSQPVVAAPSVMERFCGFNMAMTLMSVDPIKRTEKRIGHGLGMGLFGHGREHAPPASPAPPAPPGR